MINIDFSEAEERSFGLIPDGKYRAVVVSVEERMGNEYPYLNWQFVINGGEFHGRNLWSVTSFKPTVLWRLKKMLVEVFDVNPNDLKSNIELEETELMGHEVGLMVGHKTYNGEEQNDVKYVMNVNEVEEETPF